MARSETDRLAAYRQAGVDLDLSNVASQIASNWARTTWKNREGETGEPIRIDSAFSSAKRLVFDEIRNRPGVDGVFGMDGTGTKPDFYERMRKFKGLGRDLIAMSADDNPIEGGQTILVNNALIVNTLAEDYIQYIDELFQGLAEGANEVKLVLFTGEIAVHGSRLQGPTDFTVDWVGDAMGLVHRERAITGAAIQEGDEIWGFGQRHGFRCNGISLVRRAFEAEYGEDWHLAPFGNSTLGDEAIAPSTIYSGLMTALTGGYRIEIEPVVDVRGAAHISGGSIPEKVGRMLRATGLGAEINDPFELPGIMKHAQEVTKVKNRDGSSRPMNDEEMITTWHGGQGYVVVINERDSEALKKEAEIFGVETKKIGQITRKPGIRVTSKGVLTPGKIMKF